MRRALLLTLFAVTASGVEPDAGVLTTREEVIAQDAPSGAPTPSDGGTEAEKAVEKKATASPVEAPTFAEGRMDPRKARIDAFDRTKVLPAQPERSRNTITINPLALLQSQLALEYERALNDWFTAYISPQPTLLITAGRLELGMLAEAGVRLVLIGKPPGGLYLAPLVAVAMSRETASGVSTLSLAFGYGGMVGVTFVFWDRLVLSGGFGVRYLRLPSATNTFPLQALPRLSVGMAF